MGEGFLGVLTAPWAPAIAAYLFGMATGWLIFGGRADEARPKIEAEDGLSTQPASGDACPQSMKVGAVESELRSARALLDETDVEAKELAAELSTLDAAIMRANGRLKLVLDAVMRAGRR